MSQTLPSVYDMLKLADPLFEKGWRIKFIDYMDLFKISKAKGNSGMVYDIMLTPEQFYEIFLKDGGHKRRYKHVSKNDHQYTLQDLTLDKVFEVKGEYFSPLSLGCIFANGEYLPNRHHALVAHVSIEDFTVCNMEFHPHNIY
jgi:hypothetical protein